MSDTHYCVRWDSYKQNFANGFLRLQQDEELVDMTLAVNGHLIKVHKTILALASPFFKEMLKTVYPSQYPVLFLNNVDQEALQYILEYIYHGEVNIARAKIPMFIKTARTLQIKGVDSIVVPPLVQHSSNPVSLPAPIIKNIAANIKINSDAQIEVQNFNNDCTNQDQYYGLPTQFDSNAADDSQVYFKQDNMNDDESVNNLGDIPENLPKVHITFQDGKVNIIPKIYNNNSYISDHDMEDTSTSVTINKPIAENCSGDMVTHEINNYPTSNISDEVQYTISNRGAVQLIHKDFIYNSHFNSKTKAGAKCQWRCLDYRSKACPAIINTINGVVKLENVEHKHVNHASKIRKKRFDELIFPTISDAIITSTKSKGVIHNVS